MKRVKFGRDHALYLVSQEGAPRGKVLRLALTDGVAPALAEATVAAPEAKGAIQSIAPADSGLYVTHLVGGPSDLYFYRHGRGKPLPVLPVSAVAGLESWRGRRAVLRER